MAGTDGGGFTGGDEVRVSGDRACACGPRGPYIHPEVSRYSEKQGGDDKITCLRTADAVEDMLDHMNAADT
mgnify:CR=1 FL=1